MMMRNFLPRSISSKPKLGTMEAKIPDSSSENTPPIDPNIQINQSQGCSVFPAKDSIGGNPKVPMTCTESADDDKNRNETMGKVNVVDSTSVVKKIKDDHNNDLSDQIRDLKEELVRAKTQTFDSDGNRNRFQGRNARDSLNQLRVSLNRSLVLPRFDNEPEEEVDVDETDVKELHMHLHRFHNSSEENSNDPSRFQLSSLKESFETDMTIEDDIISVGDSDISSNSRQQIVAFDEPPLSESPKIGNIQRKSMVTPSEQPHKPSELDKSSFHSPKVSPSPTESLAASLQRGLQIVGYNQQSTTSNKSSVSFSFGQLTLKPCPEADTRNASVHKLIGQRKTQDESPSYLCSSCQQRGFDQNDWAGTIKRKEELEKVCIKQEAKIEQLNQLVQQYKQQIECYHLSGNSQQNNSLCIEGVKNELVSFNNSQSECMMESCEVKEIQKEMDCGYITSSDMNAKEALIKEIQSLKSKLQFYTNVSVQKSSDKLRASWLSQSIQMRKSGANLQLDNKEELENERQRWMEMESDWISLTDELRVDLECKRQHAEKVELELMSEKECTKELDDALQRAVLGHARMVEQFAEIQEKYDELVGRNRLMTEWISDVKKAVLKAGSKGKSRFSKSLAAELSAMRLEREKERESLKRENKSLRIQLRDTAEAVHAAGELLVRLREAEQATSIAEEYLAKFQEENENLKNQVEKLKQKHKIEMEAMKQYLAKSRLPESALQPLYREDSDMSQNTATFGDQDWRAEFRAAYQDHY